MTGSASWHLPPTIDANYRTRQADAESGQSSHLGCTTVDAAMVATLITMTVRTGGDGSGPITQGGSKAIATSSLDPIVQRRGSDHRLQVATNM